MSLSLSFNHSEHEQRQDLDKLYGAVAAYLMIAILGAFLHGLVQYFYPGAYSFQDAVKLLDLCELIFFSFTVLTTAGFGDITPMVIQSRFLTLLEAVTGVMYVAILIARLTGVYPVATKPLAPLIVEENNMKTSESRRWICMTVCASMCALLPAPASAQSDSGFLKDYSQLQPMKDAKGTERRVWISDKANWQNYRAILIDRVEFHPKPDGTPQVTLGALYDIRDYLNAGLPKAVEANIPVAKAAGPGVLRLRSAITAVSVDKSLKPYQLVPIALLFTAARRSAGTAAYDVKLQAEFELLDSVSGEVLAAAVREAQGLEVHGDQPVTLKLAQPQLDLWLAAFQEEVASRVKKPASN